MKGRVAWVVPYPIRGSGGHATIFQNVRALTRAGYQCHVYLARRPHEGAGRRLRDAAQARTMVEEYFGPVAATFSAGMDVDGQHDLVFATSWFTADAVRRAPEPCIRAYFIQDFEAAFLPMGDQCLQALNTFRYGFQGISIGRWLPHKLAGEFGMRVQHFDFCADHTVYRPLEARRELAVCFVYQPDKPRRCSLFGAQALALVKRQRPDVQVWLYGSDRRPRLPFSFRHLGLLTVAQCNELYNRCAVGLCLSSTNPSRVPFEMMAAGLPVVDLWGPNTIHDLPASGVCLAEPTPESVAVAILELLGDAQRRSAMSEAGRAFMEDRDLSAGFDQFVRFVDELMAGRGAPAPIARIAPLYDLPAHRAPDPVAGRLRNHLDGVSLGGPPGAQGRSLAARVARRLRHTLRVLLTGQ